MSRWLRHLEQLLQRPLTENDFIFPAISSTGKLKFGEPASRTGFESLMDEIVKGSGVLGDRNGKFTTHCFRRGGAQYRFMWASRRWSLKAVKWWGGWSSNDNVGTIMRYLLDELMSYEEGFGNIMMEDRPVNRHETFMGSQSTNLNPSSPVTVQDLKAFGSDLIQKMQQLSTLEKASPSPSPSIPIPFDFNDNQQFSKCLFNVILGKINPLSFRYSKQLCQFQSRNFCPYTTCKPKSSWPKHHTDGPGRLV